MKKKNGYTVIDLLIVIVVFGVIAFVTISKVSYALSDDKSELYNLEIKYIENQAIAYGNTIKEELKNENKEITVNFLVSEKYLEAEDDKGNIFNPQDESKTLNENKIKLSYDSKNDKVKAKYQD